MRRKVLIQFSERILMVLTPFPSVFKPTSGLSNPAGSAGAETAAWLFAAFIPMWTKSLPAGQTGLGDHSLAPPPGRDTLSPHRFIDLNKSRELPDFTHVR